MKKIKILFAVPTLDALGVQHDILTLINNWDFEEFEVKLLLNSRTGDFADQFSEKIESIEVDNFIFNIPKIRVLERMLYGYYRAISSYNPDVIISFVPFSNYSCFLSKKLYRQRFSLVVSEHAHVSAAMKDSQNMDNLFMKIYRKSFKYVYNNSAVDIVKCISHESMDDLLNNHKIIKEKTVLIHNPIPIEEIIDKGKEIVKFPDNFNESNRFLLVNSGRITFQKRQDLLIKAFANVNSRFPDTRLLILGKGSQNDLLKLAQDLRIADKILFAGFQKNPWKWVSKAQLFVLTSCWEGLPCVISETMALNVPIVSTDCPSGPKEMLMDGQLGTLAKTDDIDDITNKILLAITNYSESQNKANAAIKKLDRYEPKSVTQQYINLTKSLIK